MSEYVVGLTPDPFVKVLCEMLGIPKHAKSFTLRVATNEIVTVEVEYYPQKVVDVTELSSIAREYECQKLEPVKETYTLGKKYS